MDVPPYLVLGLIAALLLAVVNLLAFAAFGIDKKLAQAGDRRISEDTLLSLALFGGSAGAYAGRRVFRHKTRKQPFSNHLFGIVVLQAMTVAGAATWFLTG